jgi:hypothetical protein
MKKITLKTRLMTLLVNNSVNRTFTLKELKKQWRVSWHRKDGIYRAYNERYNLFMHSFVHDTIRPMKESKLLRRLSPGVYQITKIGERVINKATV